MTHKTKNQRQNTNYSTLRGFLRLSGLALLTLILLPLQILYFILSFGGRRFIGVLPNLWYRVACPLVGIRIHVSGQNIAQTLQADRKKVGILYVANHAAILDIPVLGSLLKATFIAKSDIASWPVFGFLAKTQATIFIERKPRAAQTQKKFLRHLLATNHHLILFPEGTTSNGAEIYPFKSSLFAALLPDLTGGNKENPVENIYIQPVTIYYSHLNGRPINNQKQRDEIAWYGDMVLAPHLWNNFKGRSIDVHVHFGEPVQAAEYQNRKILAQTMEKTVSDNFTALASKQLP